MLLIYNSDFISKVDNVIKHLGDNTAKNIIKKAEVICNDTKVLADSLEEFSNTITDGASKSELSRIDYLRNKYGTLTSEQINNRINLRKATHDKLYELIESELKNGMTKKKIQKKLGPAVAGVYDPVTGKYYFGINNLDGDLPQNLHKLLEDNYINMPKEGIFAEYNDFTLGAGSHAEIYALNEALIEREVMGIPVKNLDELTLTVLKGPKCGWKKMGLPMPRCPHCEYITGNVNYFPEVLKYEK